MNRFTVEDTNLLSIYHEGSKAQLTENINATLPYMDADMRELAIPLCAGSAATAITDIVSYLTTGTSAYARSLSLIRCFANGFGLPYFPLISSCMPSFLRPRIKSVVPYAARSLRQGQTASNTARTAASVSRTGRQRSA